MNNNPFFSIILPIYNVEEYLSDCINSILNQTFTSYEIICVNDGSVDRSGEICDSLKEKHHNMKVYHKSNEGLGLTRNFGLRKATGKYIFFIDSDDFLPKYNCLEKIYNRIVKNPVDVLNINFCSWSFETKKFDYSRKKIFKIESEQFYFKKDKLFTPSACMKICRRDLLVNHDIYFEKGISEDFLWTAKLLKTNPSMGYLYDDYYYCYRNFRKNSLTQSKNINNLIDWNSILQRFYLMNEYDNDEILKMYFARSYFQILMTFSKKYDFEDINVIGLIETLKRTKSILRNFNVKKAFIMYFIINLLGEKMTIKLIKIRANKIK